MSKDIEHQEVDENIARRYRALFENMSEGFVICESIRGFDDRLVDYWVRDANPVFRKRAPGGADMIGRRQLEIRPDTSARWFSACARAAAGEAVRFEYHEARNGRWYDVHMMRLSETEFGQFFVDITERKRAEARQAELFDELNHRVKNNLAIVSSILELQARESPPEVRGELAKAVDRIRSIADLHTALHQQHGADQVEVGPYLEALAGRLNASLFPDGRVRVEVGCDPVTLLVGEAVSLGLIVNELVTNAAKHAFGRAGEGRVQVSLRAGAGRLVLVVADDGPGTGDAAHPRVEGLGLRIVRSLARGMGGTVQVREGPGTAVEVAMPSAGETGGGAAQGRLL